MGEGALGANSCELPLWAICLHWRVTSIRKERCRDTIAGHNGCAMLERGNIKDTKPHRLFRKHRKVHRDAMAYVAEARMELANDWLTKNAKQLDAQ